MNTEPERKDLHDGPEWMEELDVGGFFRYRLAVGTITHAEPNLRARVPAYVLRVNFGPYGEKSSSAQLTARYRPRDLVGRQVVGVLNFPVKRIAGVASEVLILGGMVGPADVVLLAPDAPVPDGTPIA